MKKIYIKDWLTLKPYDNHSITDNYYLKLCNVVKKLFTLKYNEVLSIYFNDSNSTLFSCFIVSYFEDIISETNIFSAFTQKHENLYHKRLPFYKLKDYYSDEINIEDVQFLLWYFLNTIQDDLFINPHKPIFKEIAYDIMVIFEEHYEYAPENKLLKKFYTLPENETDFYKSRELIDAILFRSYLFFTDTFYTLKESEYEIIENSEDLENIINYLRANRDDMLLGEHTKLLSLMGKE